MNKLRGIVNCVAVRPGYGDRRKAMLEDIAMLTGAEPVFKDLGGDLEKVTLKQLGRAKKVTVTADTTTIIEGAGKAADVSGRIKQIRREIETTESNYDKEKLQERCEILAGGVAQVNVGAVTGSDEGKGAHQDAPAPAKAALEEGIVGRRRCARALPSRFRRKTTTPTSLGYRNPQAGSARRCARSPNARAGRGRAQARARREPLGSATTRDRRVRDLVEAGIVDPAKVTRTALQNAVSVATMLLSTNCLVPTAQEEEGRTTGAAAAAWTRWTT